MIAGKEVLSSKQEVWLKTPYMQSISAIIAEVEEDIFWTNLPKNDGQVLMLLENQPVEVGISLAEGFYSAETYPIKIQDNYKKFYGFAIPENFVKTQKRNFLRASYAANVLFKAGDITAQTALINFSAGGLMVFLVPELEKILALDKEPITVSVNIDDFHIELQALFSWKKSYNNIPFAGFEFHDLDASEQDMLAELAAKHANNKWQSP